jgi:hypothetical protein
VWWLPAKPDQRVFGTLRFEPLGGIKLELLGKLSPPEGPDPITSEWDVIFGAESNGSPMTLLNCVQTGLSQSIHALHDSEFQMSSVKASVLLKGDHYETLESVCFPEITFEFSHARNWADLAQVKPTQEGTATGFLYERPESVSVALLNGDRITLDFDLAMHIGSDGASMTKGVSWNIKASNSYTFQEWWKIMYRMSSFLTLATRQAVQPLSAVYSRPIEVEISDGTIRQGMKSVEMFWRISESRSESDTIFGRRMLFIFQDFGSGETARSLLEIGLRNWFEKQERLETVCELYVGTIHNQKLYPTHRFLNLVLRQPVGDG